MKAFSLTHRIPKRVQQLTPYQTAARDWQQQQLWLNANENPFGQTHHLHNEYYHRYPEFQPPELITRYADYAGLIAEQVLATRGADEGIELLVRAFCEPGQDQILICPPTYGMYEVSAATFGIETIKVPLQTDFSLDLPAIQRASSHVKLVFLCSPNNPTGHLLAAKDIRIVLEHFADQALVVIDEAYIEFAYHEHKAEWLKEYPNLVILRTLSKAFALAGIRCGFTLAHPDVIQVLTKVSSPFPIPMPVADVAIQALSVSNYTAMQINVNQLNRLRTQLVEALQKFSFVETVYPSVANFVLMKTERPNELLAHLVQDGILIRDQQYQPLLNHCVRISIGSRPQLTQLIQQLEQF